MWPVTWPTEANENTRVARGTLSAITVGSSNLCSGPKFRAAAPNVVADQNFSVVLDLIIWMTVLPLKRPPLVFTRGQFWPSGIVIACVRVCVRVCVNHLLVRAITRDPFKLGSPNLDQRCKRPWLRSLLFGGQLTLIFKVKFNFKVRIYPILSLSGPLLTTYSS